MASGDDLFLDVPGTVYLVDGESAQMLKSLPRRTLTFLFSQHRVHSMMPHMPEIKTSFLYRNHLLLLQIHL
jgi:hypothetical protein